MRHRFQCLRANIVNVGLAANAPGMGAPSTTDRPFSTAFVLAG